MQPNRLASRFDDASASWDAIYTGDERPLLHWWNQRTRQNVLERFRFVMEHGAPWTSQRVLDVGCGSGRYGLAIAACGAAKVVGLDISAGMITLAQRSSRAHGYEDRCRFWMGDVREFHDPHGFETVIAVGFFDYIPNPTPLLSHLRTMTKGSLFATFPTRWAYRVPFRWFWWACRGCTTRFYTRAEVAHLCKENGFEPRTLIRRGPIFLLKAVCAPLSLEH